MCTTDDIKDYGPAAHGVYTTSALKGSAFTNYIVVSAPSYIVDRDEAFTAASATLAKRLRSMLVLPPRNSDYSPLERRERVKLFIIKLLLYVGCKPGSDSFGAAAMLMELRTRHPELPMRKAIEEISQRTATPHAKLDRLLEKSFSIYDETTMKRVTELTDTEPLTSKDIINDLAVYIRRSFYGSGIFANA